jgi:hypothetical protein
MKKIGMVLGLLWPLWVSAQDHSWDEAHARITSDHAVMRGDQMIVPAGRYNTISPIGNVAIVSKDRLVGLINSEGRPITPLKYNYLDHIDGVSNGSWILAVLETPDGQPLRGMIDTQGRTIVEPAWDDVELVTQRIHPEQGGPVQTQGVAFMLKQRRLIGFADLRGKVTVPPSYTQATQVRKDDSVFLLSAAKSNALCDVATGQCPVPATTQPLRLIDPERGHGVLLMGEPGRMGVITHQAKALLAPEMDDIQVIEQPRSRSTLLSYRRGQQRRWAFLRPNLTGGVDLADTDAPLPEGSLYDGHREAQSRRALIDARYLPEGIATPEEVRQAQRSGRLKHPLFPSIQISDWQAYVSFSELTSQASPLVDNSTLVRCTWTGGWRLLAPPTERGTPPRQACALPPDQGLHFRQEPDGSMTCVDCEPLALPTRWIQQSMATGTQRCAKPPATWSQADTDRDYAQWVGAWARHWSKWLRGEQPDPQNEGLPLVRPSSRAMSTLSSLVQDEESLIRALGLDPKKAPKGRYVDHLVKWLKAAKPEASGGIYPDPLASKDGACDEVWYVSMPGLKDKLAKSNRGFPLMSGYHLPPSGQFERNAYPFLTFQRTSKGLALAGISREFLQLVWWMEGGQ